ncbi:hypothetical protein [Listeria valentina]|uniref:hypothetical protein n=1 Tax=Listeria valentina TaxID=2705293 RepID=UPI00142FAC72|nr:hypothetical protein [Listeria valentina]
MHIQKWQLILIIVIVMATLLSIFGSLTQSIIMTQIGIFSLVIASLILLVIAFKKKK